MKQGATPPERQLLGRRDLLGRLTRWVLAAGGVGALFVGLRPLWPRAGRSSAVRLRWGPASELAPGQVDGRLLREHWVWVVRDAQGIYALSARCTHLGCRLQHDSARGRLHCNCHGSLFSLEGDLLRGPASRHLERVAVRLTASGQVEIDPTVRYHKELGEWALPGAFVRLRAGQRPG